MPNIARAFRDEVIRLSRKEAKAAFTPVRKPSVAARKALADLKRRVSALEKATKSLAVQLSKLPQPQPEPAEGKKARITGKGMRSLRKKLRLTQGDFGRLVGVSSQNVYQWERKDGALRVRNATRANILSIRDLGAREAKARLAEMKPVKKTVSKRAKSKRVVKKAKAGRQAKK